VTYAQKRLMLGICH
jgi:hypothetical protein